MNLIYPVTYLRTLFKVSVFKVPTVMQSGNTKNVVQNKIHSCSRRCNEVVRSSRSLQNHRDGGWSRCGVQSRDSNPSEGPPCETASRSWRVLPIRTVLPARPQVWDHPRCPSSCTPFPLLKGLLRRFSVCMIEVKHPQSCCDVRCLP